MIKMSLNVSFTDGFATSTQVQLLDCYLLISFGVRLSYRINLICIHGMKSKILRKVPSTPAQTHQRTVPQWLVKSLNDVTRLSSAGETPPAGPSRGAAWPPRGRLRGPGSLPVA